MGFSLSASVNIKELDLTTTVPAVATSIGAMVGTFKWGPVNQITLVDGENSLVKKFSVPSSDNYEDWFSASNFLAYSNTLQLIRVVGALAVNAGDVAGELVENFDQFEIDGVEQVIGSNTFIAKYPGSLGNQMAVSTADATGFTGWADATEFDYAPTGTEFFVTVRLDGVIVEKFVCDLTPGSKDDSGNNNYFADLINRTSQYVFVTDEILDGITGIAAASQIDFTLVGGVDDDSNAGNAERQLGYDLFANPESVDVNLVMQGGGSTVIGQYILQNIAEVRRDCVALLSPSKSDVVGNLDPVAAMLTLRNTGTFNVSSSYGFLDGNWKYQYDKYNDKYRWLPMNGDMAGLMARTDDIADPWYSPGGPNRGQVKNVIKLAFQPSRPERDALYQKSINPIVSFPGEGTMLYGDKTMQAKPSAFDRINVRRLFIVLEKAIATFSKYSLFEFNDPFTRTQFINAVEPFLRNVQGRRGIIDFRVIADETNNTGDVIDRNEFISDIYIKPNRSINFIYLNFIAVRSGVTFEEIIGN